MGTKGKPAVFGPLPQPASEVFSCFNTKCSHLANKSPIFATTLRMTGVVRRSCLQFSAAATTLTPHIQLAAETKTGFPLRSIFQLVTNTMTFRRFGSTIDFLLFVKLSEKQ